MIAYLEPEQETAIAEAHLTILQELRQNWQPQILANLSIEDVNTASRQDWETALVKLFGRNLNWQRQLELLLKVLDDRQLKEFVLSQIDGEIINSHGDRLKLIVETLANTDEFGQVTDMSTPVHFVYSSVLIALDKIVEQITGENNKSRIPLSTLIKDKFVGENMVRVLNLLCKITREKPVVLSPDEVFFTPAHLDLLAIFEIWENGPESTHHFTDGLSAEEKNLIAQLIVEVGLTDQDFMDMQALIEQTDELARSELTLRNAVNDLRKELKLAEQSRTRIINQTLQLLQGNSD